MTEEQRRDRIAFGLEEPKYLAANYLDEEHAKEYLSAMETIARYGMNGEISEDGKVTYHIEKGPLVGAPNTYVSQNDILKKKAPELYEELRELNQSIARGETGWGKKLIELQKRIHQFLNGDSGTAVQGKQLTKYEETAAEYKAWKKEMNDTKLPDTFDKVNYADVTAFFESLNSQSSLTDSCLTEAALHFEKWLES